MPVPLPSRRTVLRGLAGLTAVAISGCTGDGGPEPSGPGVPADPDFDLLVAAVNEKQELLLAYEATLTRHPQLQARLQPMRADHTAHLAALIDLRPDLATRDRPSADPSASASPGSSASAGRENAVEALAVAELAAAGRRIGQCREARDPLLARLLASIGGSEAAHTALLRAGSS